MLTCVHVIFESAVMTFFSKKHSHDSILKIIQDAKKLLLPVQEDKSAFMELLTLRLKEFEDALEQNSDPYEEQRILEQYHRFVKALYSCLHQPKQKDMYINSYQNIRTYYPVGITDIIQEPIRHKVSLAATVIGIGFILASIAIFPFNPLISAILFPIGLTFLIPGAISLLTPGSLDIPAKQNEEKIIFQMGAKLIEDSKSFDETYENDGQLKIAMI